MIKKSFYLLFVGLLCYGVYAAPPVFGQKYHIEEKWSNPEYKKARRSFCGESRLWIGSSLDQKIKGLKKPTAICYVIFEKAWYDDEMSIFELSVKNGAIVSARRIGKDASEAVSVSEALSYCKSPAMLSYNNRVYLNAPTCEFAWGFDGPIGYRLLEGIYGICTDLYVGMPKTRVDIRIETTGRVEFVGKMALSANENDIFGLLFEKRNRAFKENWQKEHDKKIREMVKRPPVVYGSGNMVIKRIDGTFEIPRKVPTRKWTETVYKNGHGHGWVGMDSLDFNIDIPVGTKEQEKEIKQIYDYHELKNKMDEYQEELERLKNEDPLELDRELLVRELRGCVLKIRIGK